MGEIWGVDWEQIKAEYITTTISTRDLADKYGVPYSTLNRKCRADGWVTERRECERKVSAKLMQKSANSKVKIFEKMANLSEKLLSKIDKSIDNIEPTDYDAFKKLTGAIKDIKDIQMLKSDIDIREQEARIAKLEKEAQEDNADPSVQVVIANELSDYSG